MILPRQFLSFLLATIIFYLITLVIFPPEIKTMTDSTNKLQNALDQMRAGVIMKEVNLADCRLTEVPEEIFLPNIADHVELLNLGGNLLNSLPEKMSNLKSLRILFFAKNLFKNIPKVLGKLNNLYMLSFKENKISHIPDDSLSPSIEWLILTGNEIEFLPPSIGKCTGMRKLMLALNKLNYLPEEMKSFENLELIRLAGNRFTALPDWLFHLPKLSWIAYAGNPIPDTENPSSSTHVVEIDWHTIVLKNKIGEGASGTIYIADSSLFPTQQVAVKLFKGEGTSDGFPADEMKASIAADAHPNCLLVLGKVIGSPSPALVLPLISEDYKPLGNPPSFESITRDTYPATTSFPFLKIINILQGIIAVMMHLHSKGISHGDIYAHNILINSIGKPLLVDFGAATFFKPFSVQAKSMERIETRAFGCLIDDLISRAESPSNAELLAPLLDLQARCMSTLVHSRPDFKEIDAMLKKLSSVP